MTYKSVTSYWCTCAVCGHEWLAVVIPLRCAGRKKCRAWGRSEEGAAVEVAPDEVPQVERQPAQAQPKTARAPRKPKATAAQVESSPEPAPAVTAPASLQSAGQTRNAGRKGYDHAKYLSLSNSDRLRYLREHPAPDDLAPL